MEYAKGNHGPVCAINADIPSEARCYLCNEKVYVKEQYKRKRNGIEHTVRRHFCHYSKSTLCTGSVETAQHLAAKDALINGDQRFYFACQCGVHVPIAIEGTRSLEVPWRENTWPIEKQSRRLDVGIVYKDTDIVVGAIEVVQTHFMEQDKIDELTAAGLAWCEVTAENVLSSRDGHPIRVFRCAVSMCDTCLEREKIEAQTKAELKATMAAREKLKQQIEKDAVQKKIDVLFEKMNHEQNAAYHKAIDEKIAPFKFSEEIVVSIHKEFIMHHKFTAEYHEFTYENLVALTGFVPDQAAIKKVESKWARMIEKLEQSASSEEYAQQKLNQQVLAVVKGKQPPLEETARELLEAEPEDVLTIGKYKGMTLEQIFNRDPDYVRTLAMYTGQKDGNKNRPETRHNTWSGAYKIRARELLQGICLVCYDTLDEKWMSWCPSCYTNMVYRD